MLKLGHQVHIICHKKRRINTGETEAPNSDIEEIERMGAIIHYVEPEEENNGTTPFGRNIFSAFQVHMGYIINTLRVTNKLYRQGEIDIIHANMYTPVIPGFLFGKIRRIPVVMTLHNPTLKTGNMVVAERYTRLYIFLRTSVREINPEITCKRGACRKQES